MKYFYPWVVYRLSWAQSQVAKRLLESSGISESDIEEFVNANRHKGSLSMEIYMNDCKNISEDETPSFVVTKRFIRIFNRDFLKYLRSYMDARHVTVDKHSWKESVRMISHYTKDQFERYTPERLTNSDIKRMRRNR